MEKENPKKKISIIFSIASTILLAAAVLLLFYVLGSRILGRNPTLFGYSFYVVKTDSMTPEIEVHDLVIAKKTDKSKIKTGDDILFVSLDPDLKGMTIVHRVIDITNTGEFVTQGIKPGAPQDSYTVINPIGKVVDTYHTLGRILNFLETNRNIIFIIMLIVIGCFIVLEIVNIVVIIINKKAEKNNDRK